MMLTVDQFELGPFTQEIAVLVVFTVSFLMWRHMKENATRRKSLSFSEASARKLIDSTDTRADATMCNRILRQATRSYKAEADEVSLASMKAAEQQMLRHLENREFTRALNMYRGLERDGRDQYFGEDVFAAFVQSAIRVGKVDVVERMLRAMRRNRLQPSTQFWQTTFKMLSSRKHFSACLSSHAMFGMSIPCDKTIYSCLINAALEVGVPDRAAAMLERFGESGVHAKDHVLFFRTYVALGDCDTAEACFHRLGTETTTLMLNLLLLTCINAKDPHRAHRLLKEAHELEAESQKVDVVSYNTVIKGFAQAAKPTRCFDVLHEMLERNLEPDDITFGTLLDACIVDNDLGAAKEVVNLLLGRNKSMDTVMSSLFMKGLVRANCLPKAMELYQEMKKREGAHPDIVTYSVLIKALVDQHDLDRALQLVEDMKSAGLAPDDIILTHLLEGCRHAGNHALGKKLFEDMIAAGVQPSEFTLVTMLKLHGRCGAHQDAYDLVSAWEEKYGIKPSVIHYTCLMSGCLRTKRYDQAWAAYELMIERKIEPDSTAVSTLMPSLASAQQWERVVAVARKALSAPSPIEVPSEILNNALSQMLNVSGMGRHAEQLQQLMGKNGVVITARNAKRLA